jgi:ubiquinol-cytochrome c reductase cytochrome b subunit
LFAHYFRGILQSSFFLKTPWLRGWLIILLTIMSAFLGYVLPWGQISFWGATVIINLLSVLPKGKLLVIWLWGGFYVSSFTCRFFYALHFLTPLVVLGLAGVHLFLLHYRGSSIPGGIRRSNILKIKFSHFFLYKDLVNLRLLWVIWMTVLRFPDWSADPVNFVISDLSNSPIHIQPEWYFLHLYAVLRSIPNKLGGLIGFALALVLLLILSLVVNNQSLSQWKRYDLLAW